VEGIHADTLVLTRAINGFRVSCAVAVGIVAVGLRVELEVVVTIMGELIVRETVGPAVVGEQAGKMIKIATLAINPKAIRKYR
jgi:hypothetical protein